MKTVAVAITTALFGVLAIVPSASAHARYKSSTPGSGEVVQITLAQVEVFFTQNIQKVGGTYDLQVEKDRGPLVTAGPAALDEGDRSHLSVPLRPNLAPGRYVVNWKNVSDDDGDPAAGAFSFYVRTQPNAVDLQNDQQLAKIGAEAEVTPGAAETPGSTAVSSGTATTPGVSVSVTAAAATSTRTNPTAVGTATSSKPSGGNATLYVVAAIAATALLAAAAAYAYRRRGQMRP